MLKILLQGGQKRLPARINLWCYQLPSLKERNEDIEPNIDYELQRYAQNTNQKVSFNTSAKSKYLAFSLSYFTSWQPYPLMAEFPKLLLITK